MDRNLQSTFWVAATPMLVGPHSWTYSGKMSMPRNDGKTCISPSLLAKSGSFLLGAYNWGLAWPLLHQGDGEGMLFLDDKCHIVSP